MNRLTKTFAIVSSIVLIFWDLSTLGNIMSINGGSQIFNLVMNSMLPCGLLFGITALLHFFDKSGKKAFAVIASVFFGFTALVRIFAFGLQMLLIAKGQGAKDFNEILLLIEFCGYILLAVSVVFLMVYIIKGELKRTALTLFGISAIVLIVIWIIIQWQSISQMIFEDKNFTEIVLSVFTGDFIYSLTTLVAYTLSFGWITKVLYEKGDGENNG